MVCFTCMQHVPQEVMPFSSSVLVKYGISSSCSCSSASPLLLLSCNDGKRRVLLVVFAAQLIMMDEWMGWLGSMYRVHPE